MILTLLLSVALASDILPACSRSGWVKAYLEDMSLKTCEKITEDEMKLVRIPMAGDIARLRENKLISDEPIEIRTGDFDGLNTDDISYVNLKNSKITRIGEGVFSGLRRPFQLNLQDNLIEEISSTFMGNGELVLSIDFKRNPLKFIRENALHDLPLLRWLDFADTMIEKIEEYAIYGLPLLGYLDFDGSKLKTIEGNSFEGLPSVIFMSFDRNEIVEIETRAFSKLPSLLFVNLRENKISKIGVRAFTELPSLLFVDAKDNEMESIPLRMFDTTPELIWVSFSLNRIKHIEKGAFSYLQSFSFINLARQKDALHNPIHFEKGLFDEVKKGFKVQLSNPKAVDPSTRARLKWMQLAGKIAVKWDDNPF